MQQPIKIYKREALYINKRHFKKEQLDKLKEDYTFRFYEEKACKNCEYLEDRHCDICDNCAAYKGGTQLLKQVSINGNKMVSFPAGKPKQLISRLKRYRIGLKFKGVSKLPKPEKVKARRKLKFLGELYDYQPEAVQACIDRKRGILKAPPRSGKCIVADSYVMADHGLAPIGELFRDFALHETDATEIPANINVATYLGITSTNYLYSKVVDRTYRLTASNGMVIEGTPNHPVQVYSKGSLVWVELQDIKAGDIVVGSRRKQWLGKLPADLNQAKELGKQGLPLPKEYLQQESAGVDTYLKALYSYHGTLLKGTMYLPTTQPHLLQVVLTYRGVVSQQVEGGLTVTPREWYNLYEHLPVTGMFTISVNRIEQINEPKRVYDLSVPECRHFIANGLVVHNTVMGTYLITELNGRALIVASQRDWLVGFYETFCGSDTQKPLTNAKGSGVTNKEINASRRSGERFDIGFCNTLEDFKRHDICLATVQTFQSPAGRKLLQKIRSRFKICMIDEVHYGAAPQFARFISTMNVEYLIGLTGTDSRKDMRFVLMRELIGENVYEVKKEMLQPHVRLTRTKYKYLSKARQFNWVNFVTNLENDKARLKLIAETAIRDIKDKHMVLIPLARVKAAKTLVDTINNLAGETVAVQFTGSIKKELRDQYIQDARNYKVKIMVGQAKILSTGINIPRASAIYEVTPSSNLENATQRIARILTPYKGKPTPILRFFLDDNNVRRSCYKNEWWKLIRPKFKPIIREKDAIIWNEYLKDTKTKANYLEF